MSLNKFEKTHLNSFKQKKLVSSCEYVLLHSYGSLGVDW